MCSVPQNTVSEKAYSEVDEKIGSYLFTVQYFETKDTQHVNLRLIKASPPNKYLEPGELWKKSQKYF